MIDTQAIAARLRDLPALTVTVVDDMLSDDIAVKATQDLDVGRGQHVAFMAVPGRVLRDTDHTVIEMLAAESLGRWLRPWLRPDPPVFPKIDLFPTLARRCHRAPRARGITRRTFL